MKLPPLLIVPKKPITEVVDKFREPGRSLLTPAHGTPISSKSMVDISHESLMRIWVRLKNWVDDEADAVQMYLRLAEAAAHVSGRQGRSLASARFAIGAQLAGKHISLHSSGVNAINPAFERTMIFLEYSTQRIRYRTTHQRAGTET
jgi:hypothetical protein